jgi:hypothetical protein
VLALAWAAAGLAQVDGGQKSTNGAGATHLTQLPLVEWMSKAAALPKGTALKRAKLKQMGRGCSPRKREEEARRESRATTD